MVHQTTPETVQQHESACVCARACARTCCVSALAWYDHGTVALRVFKLLRKLGAICLHPARSVSNGCAQEAHSKPVSFKFDTTKSESARDDAPDHLHHQSLLLLGFQTNVSFSLP